jgi:alpha-L-fucosidase
LLLNIPPDRRGLIHEIDAKRIKELSAYLTKTFAKNIITDKNIEWSAEVGDSREFDIDSSSMINTLLIQEDITRGQRVEKFSVEVFSNDMWHLVAEGTTIGYKRLLRFTDCKAERLRVTIEASRGTANIQNIGLYYAEPLDEVYIPRMLSDIDTTTWTAIGSDTAEAFDHKLNTAWQSDGLTSLIVDMGCEIEIGGFSYTPLMNSDLRGTIFKYRFYVSTDGKEWILCDTNGEFSNIMHNPIPQFVYFNQRYTARYFKLEPVSEINGENITTVGEIGILQR